MRRDITFLKYKILRYLMENGPTAKTRLMFISESNSRSIDKYINEMFADELVRIEHGDRKKNAKYENVSSGARFVLFITDKGRRMASSLSRMYEQMDERVFIDELYRKR